MTKQDRSAPLAVIVEQWGASCQTASVEAASSGWRVHIVPSLEDVLAPPPGSSSTTDICVPDAALFVLPLDSADQTMEAIHWLRSSERWAEVAVAVLAGGSPPAGLVGEGVYVLPCPLVGGEISGVCRAVAPRTASAGIDLGALASFSSADLIAKEISRARRGAYPFSLLLLGLNATSAGGGGLMGSLRLPQWSTRAQTAVRRALREGDTLIVPEPGRLVLLLPFTGREGLLHLEARVHDSLRPLVREMRVETGSRCRLVAGGAAFPEDAGDWRTLVSLAVSRLDRAVGGDAQSKVGEAA